jgi:hypothetical protein
MFQYRLRRFVRKHATVAVAWAMLPLVLLNGRTITGCGCNGHFEAVCRCHCGSGCGGCCGQAGQRSCCAGKVAANQAARPAAPQGSSESARNHRCVQAAEYVVVLATTSPTQADDEFNASILALLSFDLPLVSASTDGEQYLQLDTRPPNDLVVTLHRLVI